MNVWLEKAGEEKLRYKLYLDKKLEDGGIEVALYDASNQELYKGQKKLPEIKENSYVEGNIKVPKEEYEKAETIRISLVEEVKEEAPKEEEKKEEVMPEIKIDKVKIKDTGMLGGNYLEEIGYTIKTGDKEIETPGLEVEIRGEENSIIFHEIFSLGEKMEKNLILAKAQSFFTNLGREKVYKISIKLINRSKKETIAKDEKEVVL